MNHYMGVDIGTSGTKAVVFDDAGRQVALAYREYDVLTPEPGWAELDPDQVMTRCFEVIREAVGQLPARSVRGLGVSSQGEAFTAIDRGGKALSNALVSSDARASDYASNWSAEFGVEELYQITGHTAHPMFSLFKMLWLRDHRAEVWSKTQKFLCFEDLLQHRLGLDPCIGWPLAGRTMLFDVRRHEWSAAILEAIGLRPDQLARPLPSGTVAGKVAPEVGRDLGLGNDCLVVTGGHDQPCGALGAGVTEPGIAMYATGTVECITPAFPEPLFTADLQKNNLCTYDHAAPGLYATLAFCLTGGNILKWFRDEFGAEEVGESQRTGTNAYELLLRTAGNKPSGLLVLPYFTPTGTPYFDTAATGAIVGLRLTTTRGQFIRALLEGVAFEMKLNLDILEQSGLRIDAFRAVGGGAKSETWTQLKADVMDKPIQMLDVTEAGCLGAAMLARAADTQEPATEVAARWTKIVGAKAPRREIAEQYAEQFKRYKQIYPALRKLETA